MTAASAAIEIREAAAHWAARTVSGDLDATEQAAFAQWLAAAPIHGRVLSEMRGVYESPQLAQALAAFRPAPPFAESVAPRARRAGEQAPGIRQRRYLGGAIAASLAMAALSFAWFGVPRPVSEPAPSFVTEPGQIRALALGDGSEARLNGDTRISVQYGRGQRRIELSNGEAFFAVAHDADRPFVVHAGNARFTAVGTRFNVTRFQERTILTVHEGRVLVAPDNGASAPQIYAAGMRVSVADGAQKAEAVASLAAEPSWQDGWLDAGEMNLGNLVTALNRRAGTHIEASPRVTARLVSGRFRVDRPEALLHSISQMYGLRLEERDGRELLLEAEPVK